MNNLKLDKEEREILDAFEAGEFRSVMTEKRKRSVERAALETYRKDRRINIRLSTRDLAAIKKKALEEGIPYQTLVSSVLHKYVSGRLYDATTTDPLK